mmetsp:Transcript_3630/g.8321  ORF Transcript_3630/g.8321 Transcript_3630/m.8321 type:complete len:223 (+) Transcript_3630:1057-1725(+)
MGHGRLHCRFWSRWSRRSRRWRWSWCRSWISRWWFGWPRRWRWSRSRSWISRWCSGRHWRWGSSRSRSWTTCWWSRGSPSRRSSRFSCWRFSGLRCRPWSGSSSRLRSWSSCRRFSRSPRGSWRWPSSWWTGRWIRGQSSAANLWRIPRIVRKFGPTQARIIMFRYTQGSLAVRSPSKGFNLSSDWVGPVHARPAPIVRIGHGTPDACPWAPQEYKSPYFTS